MQVERIATDGKTLSPQREKDVITASVFAALIPNCHKYETALKLNVKARGVEFPPVERTKAMQRGDWMEPAVAKAVMELKPGWILTSPLAYYRCTDPVFGATPDFFIDGDARGRGLCQAKTTTRPVFEQDWSDGPPEWIVWQLRVEMLLTDVSWGCIGVLIVDPFNTDAHIYEVERSAAKEQEIVDRVRQFWDDVAAGREPEPDFSKDSETIKALYPEATPGSVLDLSGDNELPGLLEDRAENASLQKAIKDRLEEIDTRIRFALKDAETATLPGWRITNKTTDYKAYTVPARTNRVLRIYDKREQIT